MDAHVQTHIIIDANPSEVFKYVGDARRHYLWNPHLESILPKSLEHFQKGTTYKTISLLFGMKVTASNEVIEYEPDRSLCIKNDTGLLCYYVQYQLEGQHGKTKVTCDTTVTADSKAFAFAKPVLKTLAQRELQSDLESLKIAVEEQLEYPV